MVEQEPREPAREQVEKAGTVTLVGRPNAGKSTLMNRLLPEKVAIVSPRPQTTRHRIVGIQTDARGQMVFFDTPGIHKPKHRLNRRMLKVAQEALHDADVVCLLVDVSQPFGSGDQFLLQWTAPAEAPKVLLLNKIDRIEKPALLPLIARYAELGDFTEIIPISALTGDGVGRVEETLWQLLPEGPPIYDPELLTLHPERFLVAERIREKVLEQTRQELPFATAVVLDSWEEDDRGLLRLHASILAERDSQRRILVGAGGRRIKALGIAARRDLEAYLDRKIYLNLQVVVEPGWRENRRVLDDLDRASFEVGS